MDHDSFDHLADVECRQLTLDDESIFVDALELMNRTQGRDLFKSGYLNKHAQSKNSFIVGAFLNDQLIGLGISEILEDLSYYIPFDHQIVQKLKNKKIGSFSTLCVHEDLQGKGVGQKLSQLRLSWLKRQNCEVVLGVSWVSGFPHTSHRVFSKSGFSPVTTVKNFYRRHSLNQPFDCPGCHSHPCTCPAILYRLNL
jgi:GNAT superfamily N-acetyltransferase